MEFTKFAKERKRMCDSMTGCDKCPVREIHLELEPTTPFCTTFILRYPEQVEMIVAKWSAEHPAKTRLQYLLEHFPNTPLDHDGTPSTICPSMLGLQDRVVEMGCECDCIPCWDKEV